MAKINVQTRPGALKELLDTKKMSQMDAHHKTGVDRKTLLKINRGGAVKLDKLQDVANRLEVPEEYFFPPAAAEMTANSDIPEPGTIMLRKLDAARLEELFQIALRVRWHLNAKVVDDEARKFLEDFETALENFRKQQDPFHLEGETLRFQLDRLKTADDIAARLEKLAEYRLVLLGASHLFWECSKEEHNRYEDMRPSFSVDYISLFTVHLSVEPFGTQSRRTRIYIGNPPPLLAPDLETAVFVNGRQLPSEPPPSVELGDDTG
jgi:transcriptional regulator with XRE-family HTH domain